MARTRIETTEKALESFGTSPGPKLPPGTGRRDPTATTSLRKSYARAFLRRQNKFYRIIRETIVDNDALGIQDFANRPSANAQARDSFGAGPMDVRIRRSDGWVRNLANEVILEADFDAGGRVVDRNPWMNKYLISAAAKAVKKADVKLRNAGVDGAPDPGQSDELNSLIINARIVGNQGPEIERISREAVERRTRPAPGGTSFGTPPGGERIEGALATPEFAEAQINRTLRPLFKVNFEQFKAVVEAGNPVLADTLRTQIAEGIAAGLNPRDIAQLAFQNAKLQNIALTRARAMQIARTETIRAYNQATLDRFEQFGVTEVQGEAEIITAGDTRVCPICNSIEGQRFPLAQARDLIPLHPS